MQPTFPTRESLTTVCIKSATHSLCSVVLQRNSVSALCLSRQDDRRSSSIRLAVGPTSASILDTTAREFLIDRVHLGLYAYDQLKSFDVNDAEVSSKYSSVLKIILFALIALEKFSHTSESKMLLSQTLIVEKDARTINVLECYETWATSTNCLKRQIGKFHDQMSPTKIL